MQLGLFKIQRNNNGWHYYVWQSRQNDDILIVFPIANRQYVGVQENGLASFHGLGKPGIVIPDDRWTSPRHSSLQSATEICLPKFDVAVLNIRDIYYITYLSYMASARLLLV